MPSDENSRPRISFNDDAVNSDHRIFGRVVASAASLVERIAATLASDSGDVVLREVFFLEPVCLDACRDYEVSVNQSKGSFRLCALHDARQRAFVIGKFEIVLSPRAGEDDSAVTIPAHPRGEVVDSDEFYLRMSALGYEHAGVFRSVQNSDFCDDAGVIQLTGALPDGQFAPALDGLLQAILLQRLSTAPHPVEQLTVPFAFSRLHFFRNQVTNDLLGSFNGAGFELASSKGKALVRGSLPVLRRLTHPLSTVVVRSIACRLPGGVRSLSDLAAFVEHGRTSDDRIPAGRFPKRDLLTAPGNLKPLEGGSFLDDDVSAFDARFFGITKLEARAMDPQQRLTLEVVWECLELAGITDTTGLAFFVGQMGCEYADSNNGTSLTPSALDLVGSAVSVLAGRLNFVFSSHGLSETVDTACSSSLVALQRAFDCIRAGRCQRAVVIGSSLALATSGLLQRLNGNLLSSSGVCHTFDAAADGYARADGIVAVLLEGVRPPTLSPYLAVIEAVEQNHGGPSAGLTVPNVIAHVELITGVLKAAGKKHVDYWECHGTGTALGDPIELTALQKVLASAGIPLPVAIGSSKANLGHSEGAAGLVGLAKAVTIASSRRAPPLARFHVLNPNISFDSQVLHLPAVSLELTSSPVIVGVSSFGVSGTNAAVLLTAADGAAFDPPRGRLALHLARQPIGVLPFSAKSQASFEKLRAGLSARLGLTTNFTDFVILAAASGCGRRNFHIRGVIFWDSVLNKVREVDRSNVCPEHQASEDVPFALDIRSTTSISWKLFFAHKVYRQHVLSRLAALPYWHHNRLQAAHIGALVLLLADAGVVVEHLIAEKFDRFLTGAFDGLGVTTLTGATSLPVLKASDDVSSIFAEAFLAGAEVDWAMVYDIGLDLAGFLPFDRLPTYPFDRQVYWKTDLPAAFDHRLLGHVVERSDQKVVLRNWVNLDRLKLHLGISQKKSVAVKTDILALEIVLAVARCLHPSCELELHEFNVQLMDFDGIKPNEPLTTTIMDHGSGKLSAKVDNVFDIEFQVETKPTTPISSAKQIKASWILKPSPNNQISFRDVKSVSLTASKPNQSQNTFLALEAADSSFYAVVSFSNAATDRPPVFSPAASSVVEVAAMPAKTKAVTLDEIRDTVRTALRSAVDFDVALEGSALDDRGFVDIGLDSLSLIGFLQDLNTRYFAAGLSTTDLFTFTSVTALSRAIFDRLSKSDDVELPEVITTTNPTAAKTSEVPAVPTTKGLIYRVVSKRPAPPPADHEELSIVVSPSANGINAIATLKSESTVLGTSAAFTALQAKLRLEKRLAVKFVFTGPGLQMDDYLAPFDLSSIVPFLLRLATCFSSVPKLRIAIDQADGPLAGLFAGFWKAFTTEKSNKASFVYRRAICPLDADTLPKLDHMEPAGIWLITGGTKGIGLEMAKCLAAMPKVEKVIVASRKGTLPSTVSIKRLQAVALDVTDSSAVNAFVAALPCIDGIVHSAGVLSDAIIERQSLQSFEKVFGPKLSGLQNVLNAVKHYSMSPSHVVLNSSVSSLFGNFGQSNYAAANGAAEKVILSYRSQTGVGTIINWGNWIETGMAADAGISGLLHEFGFEGLSTVEGLAAFKSVLFSNVAQVAVAKVNWPKILEKRPELKSVLLDDAAISDPESPIAKRSVQHWTLENISTVVLNNCKALIGAETEESLSPTAGFIELGLDSFRMFTLAHDLTKLFGFTINVIDLFENPSPRQLVRFIASRLPDTEVVPQDALTDPKSLPLSVTPIELSAMADHCFDDIAVLPAAFEIDRFIAAAGEGTTRLGRIQFNESLPLETLQQLRITRIKEGRQLALTREDRAHGMPLTTCALDDAPSKSIVVPQLSKAVTFVAGDAFYSEMAFRGVDYKNHFCVLTDINLTTGGAATDILLSPSPFLSWLIFEAGLQTLAAAVFAHNPGVFFVPVRIMSVTINEGFRLHRHLQAVGKIIDENERFVEGDVVIMDGKKRPIVEMKGVLAVKRPSVHPTKDTNSLPRSMRESVDDEGADFGDGGRHRSRKNTKQSKPDGPRFPLEKSHSVNVKGYACRFANDCDSVDDFWHYLTDVENKTMQAPHKPRPLLLSSDPAFFNPEKFRLTPREALFIDPQHRLLLACTADALKSTSIAHAKFTLPSNTGIFIGQGGSDFALAIGAEFDSMPAEQRSFMATGTNASCGAGRIAHFLRTTGPAMTIDTGCSSFATALALACDAVATGSIEAAIVGGVNVIINEEATKVLTAAGMLSPSGRCATFDAGANGYVRAEGVAVFVLTASAGPHALGDGLVVTGWDVRHNADSAGLTVPSGRSQVEVMTNAWQQAGKPRIQVVECHGSATALGDPIEVASVAQVFPREKLVLTAAKAHIGHTEAAACAASMVMACEMLKKATIPGQRNFQLLNSRLKSAVGDRLTIPTTNEFISDLRAVMINSFGFSGTNVSVVVEKRSRPPWKEFYVGPKAILLAAATIEGLKKLIQNSKKRIRERRIELPNPTPIYVAPDSEDKTFRAAVVFDPRHPIHPKIISPARGNDQTTYRLGIILAATANVPHPNLIIADLIRNHAPAQKLALRLQNANIDLSTFANVLVLLLFKHYALPIDMIVVPASLLLCQVQAIEAATEGAFHVVSCLPSKVAKNMHLISLADVFAADKPHRAIVDLLAELFVRQKINIGNVQTAGWLPDVLSTEERLFWPLKRPSRPIWWRRDIFEAFDVVDELLCQVVQQPVALVSTLPTQNVQFKVVALDDKEQSGTIASVLTNQLNGLLCASHEQVVAVVPVDVVEQDVLSPESVIETTRNVTKLLRQFESLIFVFTKHFYGLESLLRSIAAEFSSQCEIRVVFLGDSTLDNFLTPLLTVLAGPPGFYNLRNGRLSLAMLKKVAPRPPSRFKFKKALVTGASGGIGSFLIEHNLIPAENVIGVSRTGTESVLAVDVSDEASVKEIFAQHADIDLVVHCAGDVANKRVDDLEVEDFAVLGAAKVTGTQNLISQLRYHTDDDSRRKLVVMGSAASVLGSFGQANYAWANGAAVDVAEEDPENVEVLTIAWGPWADVGMLAGDEMSPIRRQIEHVGWKFLNPNTAGQIFRHLTTTDETGVRVVFDGDFDTIVKQRPDLTAFLPAVEESSQQKQVQKQDSVVKIQSHKEINQGILDAIKQVSGLNDVNPTAGFMSLGLDSLMIEDLRAAVEKRFGSCISAPEIFANANVEALTELISSKLQTDAFEGEKNAPTSPTPVNVPRKTPVAVIGHSGTVGSCENIEEYLECLYSGKRIESPVKPPQVLETLKQLPLSAQDVAMLDPQTRQLLCHAKIVLDALGDRAVGKKIACFAAAEPSDHEIPSDHPKDLLTSMYARNRHSFVAAWLAHVLDLRGPTATVYTACSSSIVCLSAAVDCLRAGRADIALVAAAHLRSGSNTPSGMALAAAGDHSRPFDANTPGMVPADASGVVALQLAPATDAQAVILGIGISNDGRQKANFMAPGQAGEAAAMLLALQEASVDPENIEYLEAHATGTQVGDRIELAAVGDVFAPNNRGSKKLVISSVKANLGHAFAAAGLVSLFKAIGVFKKGFLPPQIGIRQKAEELVKFESWLTLESDNLQNPSLAMINSFGIGGTNASVVLQAPEQKTENIAFFFAPQGVQYPGMITEADFSAFPSLKPRIDELCALVPGTKNFSAVLADPDAIVDPLHAQLAVFILTLAAAESVIAASGKVSSFVMGHSVGEYTALVVAGYLSPEEAICLLAERSRLMAATPVAKTLSLTHATAKILENLPTGIEVSARYSPTFVAVSGLPDVIESFAEKLKTSDPEIKQRWLKTARAFHTSVMDGILNDFGRVVASVNFSGSSEGSQVIRNLDGELMPRLDAAELRTYLVRHVRQPVRLDKMLDTMLEAGVDKIVEIGPPGLIRRLLMERGHADIQVESAFLSKQAQDATTESQIMKTVDFLVGRGENVQKTVDSVATESVATPNDDNSLESVVRRAWVFILEKPKQHIKINSESNFFQLGGNSLNATQLCWKLETDLGLPDLSVGLIFDNPTFGGFCKALRGLSSLPVQITDIRVSPTATKDVFCIHAIGGTVYPFYSLVPVVPPSYNLYGIPYDARYEANSLEDLAFFYADYIQNHHKETQRPFVLLGHSLGGVLARLAAGRLIGPDGQATVIMFDSWSIGNDQINLDVVSNYLKNQFSNLPQSESLSVGAIKLAQMLKAFYFSFEKRIRIVLFKAQKLTDSPLRLAVLPVLTEELVRSMIDNGWSQYAPRVDTILTAGDHDSLLRVENLRSVQTELAEALSDAEIRL